MQLVTSKDNKSVLCKINSKINFDSLYIIANTRYFDHKLNIFFNYRTWLKFKRKVGFLLTSTLHKS